MITLTLEDLDNPTKSIEVKIVHRPRGIEIQFEGYGDNGSTPGNGSPILIEYCYGSPRVIIFGNINQEEPTHIIDLDEAAEANREESLDD